MPWELQPSLLSLPFKQFLKVEVLSGLDVLGERHYWEMHILVAFDSIPLLFHFYVGKTLAPIFGHYGQSAMN